MIQPCPLCLLTTGIIDYGKSPLESRSQATSLTCGAMLADYFAVISNNFNTAVQFVRDQS